MLTDLLVNSLRYLDKVEHWRISAFLVHVPENHQLPEYEEINDWHHTHICRGCRSRSTTDLCIHASLQNNMHLYLSSTSQLETYSLLPEGSSSLFAL